MKRALSGLDKITKIGPLFPSENSESLITVQQDLWSGYDVPNKTAVGSRKALSLIAWRSREDLRHALGGSRRSSTSGRPGVSSRMVLADLHLLPWVPGIQNQGLRYRYCDGIQFREID
jgi:hypothetical protein